MAGLVDRAAIPPRQCVITRLNGGLGNQLFQYAAGFALAERLAVPLKMDLSVFATYPLRRFELDKFQISAAAATPEDIAGYVVNPRRWQRYAGRLAVNLGLGTNKIVFRENQYPYNRAFARIRRPMYLDGYWQSEKYFHGVATKLRGELTLIKPLGEASSNVLAKILACPAISLHIRRGDYVSNPAAAEVFRCCSLDYYAAAVDYLAAQVADPHFFVFSDDPQWARENLKIAYPVQFVEANGPDRGVEDMWLMKSCRHHIIANSSFSWWAAWLNDTPGKVVVAPWAWFLKEKRNRDTGDLIPAQWLRL